MSCVIIQTIFPRDQENICKEIDGATSINACSETAELITFCFNLAHIHSSLHVSFQSLPIDVGCSFS